MRKAHMVGGGVKKDKLTENEYLIYTLAVLPELVFCHGFGILKNIYEGTFDEADLGNEQIPEWYQSKIRLETLSGEFFRDLLFVFYLVDDFEYICNRLFFYIKAQSCPEQKRMNMLLQYYGVPPSGACDARGDFGDPGAAGSDQRKGSSGNQSGWDY